MIKQSSIERLKNTIDIVDVVGNYVELKKSGGNFKGRCPFHDEKTPSFVVSPAKQIYHCFGCGVGGDAIKFVQELEKLSYPETLEKLAREFNISLEYEARQGESVYNDTTLDVLNGFFIKRLRGHNEAMSYLERRHIHHASIEKFEIGFAPSSPEQIQFLQTNAVSAEMGLKAGALARNDSGRIYARFTERITFPIYSQRGKIVGFGGRTISNHPAKYINSPETKLFDKSRLLFGYHLARKAIFDHERVIITEGYLDVIMLHQAGFNNVVATLGTALTALHIPLLKKANPFVILAYDGDNAGRAAAFKAASMLAQAGMRGGVALFEGGKDPADMVANGEIEELNYLFKHPIPLIDYIIKETKGRYDFNDPHQKEAAQKELASFLKTLPELIREAYERDISAEFGRSWGMFKHKRTQPNPSPEQRHYDLSEMTLLKTVLEMPTLKPRLKEAMGFIHFEFHNDIALQLLAPEENTQGLLALSMMQGIEVLNEQDFEVSLKQFEIRSLEKRLKQLARDRSISSDRRAFEIRRIHNRIRELRAP